MRFFLRARQTAAAAPASQCYNRGKGGVYVKVIDAHVHVYPPEFERDRDRIAAAEPWFDILTSSKVQKWGTAEQLIEAMDASGVETSFVTSFAFRSQELCRLANDYVLDAARRWPGRIRPLAVVSPLAPGLEKEIARCAEAGAVGLGELFPDGQCFDLADRSQTWRLVGASRERGLFLSFHTAEQAGHQYPGKGCYGADKAAKFCFNHPGVKVVFAHFGGGLWAYEAMPEMKLALADVYYDTAAWPWLYGPQVLDAIFAIGAGNKIMYGSDWPILNFSRFEKLLAGTGLSDEQKYAFLRGNAAKFLNSSDTEAK